MWAEQFILRGPPYKRRLPHFEQTIRLRALLLKSWRLRAICDGECGSLQNLGLDWDERVLPSIGSEVVKAAVAQYNAESLLTKREEVSKVVRDSLRMRAKDFNIILDDVAITHLSFSSEFTKAVESKQVAEQDAQRATFVVMKADQERKAAVIKAEGESEAARLISEATRQFGGGMIELRRIEAAKEIALTLSRGRNVVYLPSSGNTLLNLPAA